MIERERSVNMHVMALPPDCAGAAMTRELHFRGRGLGKHLRHGFPPLFAKVTRGG